MYLPALSTEKQATDAFSGISISTWWLSACSPPILANQVKTRDVENESLLLKSIGSH